VGSGRKPGASQVQSVDRAIAILYLLAQRGDAGVTEVAAELGEAVNLAIFDRGETMNILQEYGTSAITGRNWIVQRTPLHATASGKVLLAWMDVLTLKETFSSALRSYTPHTITEPAALEAELAVVREQGWASTTEEFEVGLNAVAAPVHDATGDVVAAVGVSGPSYRLTVGSFPEVAHHLVAGAYELSARLGHFGPKPLSPR
jgi:DNA-binding IclR family transcriptional regulator